MHSKLVTVDDQGPAYTMHLRCAFTLDTTALAVKPSGRRPGPLRDHSRDVPFGPAVSVAPPYDTIRIVTPIITISCNTPLLYDSVLLPQNLVSQV